MVKYTIAWKSTLTGVSGEGIIPFDEKEAQAIVDMMNCKYPQIKHWKKKVETKTNVVISK